jgi:hypothetical protein
MATKKSTTKTAKTSIPAKDRKRVTWMRRFMSLADKKPVTDQKAYSAVLSQRRFTAVRLAKQKAEKEVADKTRKIEIRERAIKALHRGISQLADTRDLLRLMETGDYQSFCAESQATFARAALADAGAEMEQALLDLGLIEREKSCYFLPDLQEKTEAQVTA